MEHQTVVSALKPRLDSAIEHFAGELKTLRTGRAAASMLDGVTVSAYGSPMPLNQVATVSSPEPAQLMVTPFDASLISAIRTGIQDAQLGFNPSDDGRCLRISLPPLTADRREELVKRAGKMAEEARIAVRNARGDGWEKVQRLQKDGEITEDNRDWARAELDKQAAEANKRVEGALREKESEIRTV